MRFADLFGLSLGALRQQKARTVMTTLGVVFGAFVLVISLSLGQGVQATIVRESHRHTTLRGVDVFPQWEVDASAVPEAVGEAGIVADARDPEAFAAALERVQGNAGLAGRGGVQGRASHRPG